MTLAHQLSDAERDALLAEVDVLTNKETSLTDPELDRLRFIVDTLDPPDDARESARAVDDIVRAILHAENET